MTKARDWRKPKVLKGTRIRRKTPLGWPSEEEQARRVVERGRERLTAIAELIETEPSPGVRVRLADEAYSIKRAIKNMTPAEQKHLWPGA